MSAEHGLRESGANCTIGRASRLDQTFSQGFLLSSVPRRHVAVAGSPVGEPFVDADDIADAVVAVLTDDGQARRIYEAPAPRRLSFAEAVEELAEATGPTIRYLRASTERYAALLAAQDVPEEVVVRLRRLIDRLVDGRNGAADAGASAIGREPRDRSATPRRESATPQRRGSSTAVTRIDARDASNFADPADGRA